MSDGVTKQETRLTLHWDAWVETYQAEIWGTLEPPETSQHDFMVLDMMGADGSITRAPNLVPLLATVDQSNKWRLAFREDSRYQPFGTALSDADAAWDNDFTRSHQGARSDQPSDPSNTISDQNYLLDFQRGWFKHATDLKPVRYRNAMMEADKNPDARDDKSSRCGGYSSGSWAVP